MNSHQELELKAVVPDPAVLRRRLADAGATLVFQGLMEDRRYDRNGELTAGDLVLRTRRLTAVDGSVEMILGWKGPSRRSPGGYKLREELEYKIEGGASPEPLLRVLGYSVTYVIDRSIEVYQIAGATLRLERYPRMDPLLEVEGSPSGIEVAIQISGIERREFLTDSLTEFVASFERRTGMTALIAGSSILQWQG